jgi:hypothetical protein
LDQPWRTTSSKSGHPPRMSKEEEEEPLGISEEAEEPPTGVEEEEEPTPTSSPSHLMKPPPSAREEEWCSGGYGLPPPGVREEERCSLRENRTSCSNLGPASSQAQNAC